MARPKPFADQPTWGPQDDHALLGLYVKGTALTDYADRMGWCEDSVRRAMVRLELERLPRGAPRGSRNAAHTDRKSQRV